MFDRSGHGDYQYQGHLRWAGAGVRADSTVPIEHRRVQRGEDRNNLRLAWPTVYGDIAGSAVRRYGYTVKSTAPAGTETWTRDESGQWSRSLIDGLGRLIEVTEDPVVAVATSPIPGFENPASPANALNKRGLAFVTSYTYDTQGNLKTVTQGTLDQRLYTYNSLGWLMSASNPGDRIVQL